MLSEPTQVMTYFDSDGMFLLVVHSVVRESNILHDVVNV